MASTSDGFLGAVDEAGEVEVVVVGPAHQLVRERGDPAERKVTMERSWEVEHDVVPRGRSIQSTTSCWVAGNVVPVGPGHGVVEARSTPSGGAASGAMAAHNSGRYPAMMFTPPIVVVRGSRRGRYRVHG